VHDDGVAIALLHDVAQPEVQSGIAVGGEEKSRHIRYS
jgi:hypothetical protein